MPTELGRTVALLKAQDADLATAHELMRERTKLEQAFIEGLQTLVEKHKPQPEEQNRKYTRVLITAFEQEIGANSARNTDVPEHSSIDEEVLNERIPMIQHLLEMHQAHEDAHAAILASREELKRWAEDKTHQVERMPLIELKYRWSVHHQRKSAEILRRWYKTKLPPLVESHHLALEDTRTAMIRTINTKIDCALTSSRIYSRALETAEGLLPLDHRALIEQVMDSEMNSYELRPVNYWNWFYDGQPSPLLFGIGTIVIDPDIVAGLRSSDYWWLDGEDRSALLQAEHENRLNEVGAGDVIRFELNQYVPLLPLNSSEVERLKSARSISRRDLPALLSPDESAWDPLGPTRRKELLKMVITRAYPRWLTSRDDTGDIVVSLRRKWDFDTDQPKPRER